ncbi:hypothetical protein CEXT_472421 [Caerostris extrusa]|uniref:Antistasin-like domain-containing protein n=1 Tax=Caerostris extrusa TaxID=172846 RepID=A0AAV4X117_CAEEX|nr:hypothetical protein CEXT_472421 [Caerostris extrusa]
MKTLFVLLIVGAALALANASDCDNGNCPPMIQCDLPRCEKPCRMNYNTEPCPSCDCPDDCDDEKYPPIIQCDLPRCEKPCRMNYNTEPCPSCDCPMIVTMKNIHL